MRDPRPRAGSFCWVELAAADSRVATRFYFDLFGWTARETSGASTTFRLGEQDAAGLTDRTEARAGRAADPRWRAYVSVARVDATAEKAAALGGSVLVEPYDGEGGRAAAVCDPQGAVLGLRESGAGTGLGVEGEIGSLCWAVLATTSVPTAKAFYGGLFGWTFKESAAGGGETEIAAFGRFIGGIAAVEKTRGPRPPAWEPYFRVADCDVTVAKAKAGGGRVLAGPSDIPNLGRDALLADPEGAVFAVISFETVA
jgi:predicted enzyme related to lactoylglutathione lyase